MTVAPPITDPGAIVQTQAMEDTLQAMEANLAEMGGADVELLPGIAVGVAGLQLTNTLLKWKPWDDFWINVGGRLEGVWHSTIGHLLGGSGNVTADAVSLMVQYGLHVQTRMLRQVASSVYGKTLAITHALDKGVHAVAQNVVNTQRWAAAQLNGLHVLLQAEINATNRTLGTLRAGVASIARAAVLPLVHAEIAALQRDVINPLHSDIVSLGHSVSVVHGELVGMGNTIKTHIVPELATALALATVAEKIATQAKTFVDDCGEPMCQTQGPNTSWGKLFKMFDAAALLALLTAVTALDPSIVEKASEDFAHTFGPVLAVWAEGWLGLSHDSIGSIPGEVAHDVGSIIGGLIP